MQDLVITIHPKAAMFLIWSLLYILYMGATSLIHRNNPEYNRDLTLKEITITVITFLAVNGTVIAAINYLA